MKNSTSGQTFQRINKHLMGAVRLSWRFTPTRPCFSEGDFNPYEGRTGLVFGVLSRFISRSVRARLQVSVCSGYHLCYQLPWLTSGHTNRHTDRQHFDQLI